MVGSRGHRLVKRSLAVPIGYRRGNCAAAATSGSASDTTVLVVYTHRLSQLIHSRSIRDRRLSEGQLSRSRSRSLDSHEIVHTDIEFNW